MDNCSKFLSNVHTLQTLLALPYDCQDFGEPAGLGLLAAPHLSAAMNGILGSLAAFPFAPPATPGKTRQTEKKRRQRRSPLH